MWEALQLSNSRAMLVGAVLVDTVCFGTLTIALLLPRIAFDGPAATTLLLALSITAPFLAFGIAAAAWAVPAKLDAEERGRRAILAGATLHLGVQGSVVLGMICGKGPTSLAGYLLYTFLLMILVVVPLSIYGFVRVRSVVRNKGQVGPDPEL